MNKVAIITGSRRGIGFATAKKLASMGWNIVLNDMEDEELISENVQYLKSEYGIDAIGVMMDVSYEENVIQLRDNVLEHFGRIDLLVNNAAIVEDMEIDERPMKVFDNTIRNNIDSTYLMSKYIGKVMYDNKYGKIVNVSSTNGINAFFPTSIDYDATKAAVISMTHNFALEYAPYVLVNAIAPGWVDTEMNKDLPEELVQEEENKIYLKRFAKPEEIANLISFLASDENTYINGEIIKIDGGY